MKKLVAPMFVKFAVCETLIKIVRCNHEVISSLVLLWCFIPRKGSAWEIRDRALFKHRFFQIVNVQILHSKISTTQLVPGDRS